MKTAHLLGFVLGLCCLLGTVVAQDTDYGERLSERERGGEERRREGKGRKRD